jgi:hypothetical protein
LSIAVDDEHLQRLGDGAPFDEKRDALIQVGKRIRALAVLAEHG